MSPLLAIDLFMPCKHLADRRLIADADAGLRNGWIVVTRPPNWFWSWQSSAKFTPARQNCCKLPFLLAVDGPNRTSLLQLAAVKSGAAQMFGVNLGSWLVLEQYMVPSIYAMVSGSPYGERQLLQVRCFDGNAEARPVR
jgi:hypothetical protein